MQIITLNRMDIYLQSIHGGLNGDQARPEVIRTHYIYENEIQHGQTCSKIADVRVNAQLLIDSGYIRQLFF